MDSDRLRSFLHVIDSGSLTSAAKRAHVTQPALSRSIHLLEEELGVELFQRTGRGMSATLEGLKLAERARPLVAQLDQLHYQIHTNEVKGPVSLAVTPSIAMHWVANIITSYVKKYPGAQLKTAVVLSGHMGQGIAQGHHDLGLLYSPHTTANLIFEELWQERTYFVSGRLGTRAPNERRTMPSITLKEVLKRPLILPSSESGIFALVEMEARKLDLELKPALVIDSIRLALEVARAGEYGIILTERALGDIRKSGLRATPIVRPALKRAAQLASTQSALSRPAVRALWEHIQHNALVAP